MASIQIVCAVLALFSFGIVNSQPVPEEGEVSLGDLFGAMGGLMKAFTPEEDHAELQEQLDEMTGMLSPFKISTNESMSAASNATIMETGKNEVGKNEVAILSSEYSNHPASNCIDGNVHTFCHSLDEEQYPYFMIEYHTPVLVKEVKVQARTDCCGKRVKNVVVTVTDIKPIQGSLVSGGTTIGSKYEGPARNGEVITFKSEAGVEGKYVVVQQQYTGTLNFAEVEVKQDIPSAAYHLEVKDRNSGYALATSEQVEENLPSVLQEMREVCGHWCIARIEGARVHGYGHGSKISPLDPTHWEEHEIVAIPNVIHD